MSFTNKVVWATMLQLNCSYEQAWLLLNGVPQDAVCQMRTNDAPNRGNFWAQNMTSLRGTLFAEEPLHTNTNAMQPVKHKPKPLDPVRELKYTPRSTNASMDASKKLRENVASLEATVAVLTSSLKKVEDECANMVIPPREEVAKEEPTEFKMERAARLPVKPIYVIVKEKYDDIDELADFIVKEHCNGRADSAGQCADQEDMTPNGDKKGRAYVTSKHGDDQHGIIVRYMRRIQEHFEPFMHAREAGQFGAGFSVVVTGWPKQTPKDVGGERFGVVKTIGHRTKTHTDYNAGRGTSYSCCTAMADDEIVFGILLDEKGREQLIKLSKGETIIFSSSLFHFGCDHDIVDFNTAYGIPFKDWVKTEKGEILSRPRYRAFLYMDHFFTFGKEQQILDYEGQTTIYGKGIIDEKYKVNSFIADTFNQAALWLSDEKHDGWMWPMSCLVDFKRSEGNSNGKEPVQKWDAKAKAPANKRKRKN